MDAPPKSPRRWIKYWVLAIPILGIAELALYIYFSHRAPTKTQWDDIRSLVSSWYKPGDVVIVAPEWAEPMARWSFGDALMPMRDVARADATGYRVAIEVATLGSRAPELEGWTVVREVKKGSFTVREMSNPASPSVTYTFLDHVDPQSADVRVVQGASETVCPFTTTATVESGGLGGAPTFPASRFNCPGALFVGVTIVEDDRFRPHRCIWSQPPPTGEIVTRFKNVPLGTVLRGHTGMRWVIVRDGVNPVTMRVMVGGAEIGRAVHATDGYWKSFEMPLGPWAGQTADVEFRVGASGAGSPMCFEVDSR